jgi:hypothetical protein
MGKEKKMRDFLPMAVGLCIGACLTLLWHIIYLSRQRTKSTNITNIAAHKTITDRIEDDEGKIYDLEVDVRLLKSGKADAVPTPKEKK